MSGPFGRAGGRGWFLDGTGDDPASDRDASIHESFHHRLDRTTNFGALLITVNGLVEAGLVDALTLAQLRDTCRTVHESAATYLTSLALAQLDDRKDNSQHYQRYFDGMHALVGGDTAPAWTRFHLALAAARACLQVDVESRVGDYGLAGVTAASFRNAELADERFRRLRANPPNGTAVDINAAGVAHISADDDRRSSKELKATWFDPDQHHVYEAYENAAWQEVTLKLSEAGCSVNHIDAHLPLSRDLLAAGRSLGALYDIEANGEARSATGRLWAALGPLDHESIALPEPRKAHLVDPAAVTDVTLLSAGFGEHAHLHVAIRPENSYDSFDWSTTRPPGPICLRRTLENDHGRTIEHVDLTTLDPTYLQAWPGPVIATISESQLTNPAIGSWRECLQEATVLLCDTPLIPRLRYWATHRWAMRYMFLSIEAADGGSPVMIASFEAADGTPSTPIAKPVTPQVVNTMRQAMAELDPTNQWSREDNTLVDDIAYLGIALFHIVGEDRTFGLHQ